MLPHFLFPLPKLFMLLPQLSVVPVAIVFKLRFPEPSKIKEGGVFAGPSTHGAGSPTDPAVVAI